MERIGIAASKIAKDNLLFYNLNVVLISSLFSLFIFVVTASTVIFALIILRYMAMEVFFAPEFEKMWPTVLSLSMIALTVAITLFNLLAISRNIKFPKK